ncbi:hypothetical protein [Biformimicrobium ophioploci]|uniref:Uncharacterized protein n=1 Tax=Biformimicrobium ophioploci TaxID=3036711 RepID=A0ABQ6LZE4_9GAMM|nr:hypothetical protein [Microbulbifer sp. NKW57]GMG87450.1 hypothetical protein MNKW57_17710 [Microbulbifer sp. NKW57]
METFALLGVIGFIFGIAALSKANALEKALKKRGVLDEELEA